MTTRIFNKMQLAALAPLCLAISLSIPVSAAARFPTRSVRPCVPVISTAMSSAINESLRTDQEAYERHLPKGSRVYAYDQYAIEDGSKIAHSPVPSEMVCGATTFRVIDPYTLRSRSFLRKATVTREVGWMEIGVRPGESMPWTLRRDLKLGVAYLKKVI